MSQLISDAPVTFPTEWGRQKMFYSLRKLKQDHLPCDLLINLYRSVLECAAVQAGFPAAEDRTNLTSTPRTCKRSLDARTIISMIIICSQHFSPEGDRLRAAPNALKTEFIFRLLNAKQPLQSFSEIQQTMNFYFVASCKLAQTKVANTCKTKCLSYFVLFYYTGSLSIVFRLYILYVLVNLFKISVLVFEELIH